MRARRAFPKKYFDKNARRTRGSAHETLMLVVRQAGKQVDQRGKVGPSMGSPRGGCRKHFLKWETTVAHRWT